MGHVLSQTSGLRQVMHIYQASYYAGPHFYYTMAWPQPLYCYSLPS